MSTESYFTDPVLYKRKPLTETTLYQTALQVPEIQAIIQEYLLLIQQGLKVFLNLPLVLQNEKWLAKVSMLLVFSMNEMRPNLNAL